MEIRDTRNGEWYWVNTAVNACEHISHSDKSVYGALASFAGYKEIRPSFETIAERSATSLRQAKTSVKNLIKVGYVEIVKGGGRGIANTYNLVKCPKGCKNCTVYKGCNKSQETVQELHLNGAKSAPHIDNIKIKEKDILPDKSGDKGSSLKEKTNENKDYEHFLIWYKYYPRKVGKPNAYKAWKKIKPDTELKRKMVLMVLEHSKSKQWQNPEFIPYPATWLNQERWNDLLPQEE